MLNILTTPPRDDVIELSEAIRFEHQGTDLWTDLLISEIQEKISSSNFSDAFEKLQELNDENPNESAVSDLANSIFIEAVKSTSDVDFIAIFFQHEKWELTSETLRLIDQRMNSLELPGINDGLANHKPLQPDTIDSKTDLISEEISTLLNLEANSPQLSTENIESLLSETQSFRERIMGDIAIHKTN
jgi:hypothetical protein